MKKIILPFFFLFLLFSQVNIGNNSTALDDSEALKVSASDKGLLIPNISIPDVLQAAPVDNPATSLFVYNTNTTTGKGFYFWKNNKWNAILDVNNVTTLLGIVRSSSVESTASVLDNSTIGGVPYTLGEAPSAHEWQLVPNLSQNITINKPVNQISITASGIAQINSTNTNSFMSYSLGIFIDDKLAGVRNFIITGTQSCLYNDFNLSFNFNNLSIGNHKVEIYETLRVRNITTQTISIGARHSSCSNIDSSMDKSLLNIQIVEK